LIQFFSKEYHSNSASPEPKFKVPFDENEKTHSKLNEKIDEMN
jgi:hypothetical protein